MTRIIGVPVSVLVLLSGMRWRVVCGVVTGWILAIGTLIVMDGAPDGLGAAVSYFMVGAMFGTLPGAILGAAVGLVVGLFAGLGLQLMLSRVEPAFAVVSSFVGGVGIQVAAIAVLVGVEPWSALCLVIPALAAVPLLRTLLRVANDWVDPATAEHRRDTLAA